METSKSGTRLCPHCGKPTPLAAAMCPDCGAPLPPLPEITNKPGRGQAQGTGSPLRESLAGIFLGFILPVLSFYLQASILTALTYGPNMPDLVMIALPALTLITVFAILFGIAYAIKQKRHYLGNAMQKTLFAWLILIGLLLLGVLLLCGIGSKTP